MENNSLWEKENTCQQFVRFIMAAANNKSIDIIIDTIQRRPSAIQSCESKFVEFVHKYGFVFLIGHHWIIEKRRNDESTRLHGWLIDISDWMWHGQVDEKDRCMALFISSIIWWIVERYEMKLYLESYHSYLRLPQWKNSLKKKKKKEELISPFSRFSLINSYHFVR